MELNKITTDALSLYGMPNLFYKMKDTIIYISYSNYLLLKSLVKNSINNASSTSDKNFEVKRYAPIISFVKRNEEVLNGDFLQSDPLLLLEEANVFIAIQKDTKDVSISVESVPKDYLTREENDTIYTSLIESTEILTLNECILEPIRTFEIPILAININK